MPAADPSLIPDRFFIPGYGPPRPSEGFGAAGAPTLWTSGNRAFRPAHGTAVPAGGFTIPSQSASPNVQPQQTVAGGDNAGPAGTDEADKPSPRVGGAVWWVVGIGGALAVVAVTTAVVTASKKRRR